MNTCVRHLFCIPLQQKNIITNRYVIDATNLNLSTNGRMLIIPIATALIIAPSKIFR